MTPFLCFSFFNIYFLVTIFEHKEKKGYGNVSLFTNLRAHLELFLDIFEGRGMVPIFPLKAVTVHGVL